MSVCVEAHLSVGLGIEKENHDFFKAVPGVSESYIQRQKQSEENAGSCNVKQAISRIIPPPPYPRGTKDALARPHLSTPSKSAHFPGDLPYFLSYSSLRHNKFSWVEKRARQTLFF